MAADPSTIARIHVTVNLNRSRMTEQLARELNLQEMLIVRHLPDGLSTELDATRWEELIRAFEALGNVHVIATNQSVTLEVFGQFGNFSTWGEYFNVQTKTLDMHIRFQTLGSSFAVRKPGHMDAVDTLSFQFFNHEGQAAFKVFLTFGGKTPSEEKVSQFESIRERFRLA